MRGFRLAADRFAAEEHLGRGFHKCHEENQNGLYRNSGALGSF